VISKFRILDVSSPHKGPSFYEIPIEMIKFIIFLVGMGMLV